MESIAIGILVTKTTGQSQWAGLVAAAAFVPGAVLNPLGGALADRLSRRLILATTATLQALLATALTALALAGTPSPEVLTLIAFANGCVSAIGFPTYQSLLPDLVPHDEIVGAVALSSAQWNLGRIIGPALAALVIGEDRYALAFALNAISFAGPVAVALALRVPVLAREREPLWQSMRTGLRHVVREPGLRAVFVYMTVSSLFAAPFIALIPPMALNVLDAGNRGVSTLVTAQGIGAVAMALALGTAVARLGSRRVLRGVMYGLPVALTAYYSAPSLIVATPLVLAVGLLYLGAITSFTSIAQLRAPGALRGRVLSIYAALLSTMYPIGSIAQAWLADRIGLRSTAIGAAVMMLAVLAALALFWPSLSRALDAPPADT